MTVNSKEERGDSLASRLAFLQHCLPSMLSYDDSIKDELTVLRICGWKSLSSKLD